MGNGDSLSSSGALGAKRAVGDDVPGISCDEAQHLLDRALAGYPTIASEESQAYDMAMALDEDKASTPEDDAGAMSTEESLADVWRRIRVHEAEEQSGKPNSSPSRTEDVILWAADGDTVAFEMLYLRYRRSLLYFVSRTYRLLDAHAVEDLVHEVFLEVWKQRHRLRSVRNPSAYLRGMAKNMACHRSRGETLGSDEVTADIPMRSPSPDAALQWGEIGERIAQAMDSLSKARRLAMMLDLGGLTAKQIALQLGCTPKAAERLIEKARQDMVLALSHCGEDCAATAGHPDQCRAKKEDLHCLKSLYSRRLRND